MPVADSTRSFDPEFWSDRFSKKPNVLDRSVGSPKSGRGFDKVGSSFLGEFAGGDLFIPREQAGFEDHFDDSIVRGFDDVAEFAKQGSMIPLFEPANIDDDIHLVRTVVDGGLGLKAFHVGFHRAQRKADHGDYFQVGVLEQLARFDHARTVDTNSVEAMLACFAAEFLEVSSGRLGPEKRVLDP